MTISATADDANHVMTAHWNSPNLKYSGMSDTETVVATPPTNIEKLHELWTKKATRRGVPKEQIAKKEMMNVIMMDLPMVQIRQAMNSWTGVDMATWMEESGITIDSESGQLTVTIASDTTRIVNSFRGYLVWERLTCTEH